ncbi:MAG: DegT/DnrJ/EryC1/StrS family aminotransferase [Fibrobacterota bacterium]
MKLNFIDLKRQYESIKEEVNNAVIEVMESCAYVGGEHINKLEEEASEFCGCSYGVGTGSGTDSLLAALMALDIKSGDEVITTPFTFIATAETIALLGAKPVFADIDPITFNIDPQDFKKKITSRTKAVIPVHLYGNPADMDEICSIASKKNIRIIEDSAQAIGAVYKGKPVCSIGDIGCLSFFPSKNLGCYGDGGMAVTNDEKLYKKMKMLINHGSGKKYNHKMVGYNMRLDNIQAAVLRIKLRKLEGWLDSRQQKANYYTLNLSKIKKLTTPSPARDCRHVYNQYTIRAGSRNALSNFLNENGIPTAVHYPKCLHMQEAFSYLGYKKGDLPNAEKAAREVVSLPMFPEIKKKEQDMVIKSIEEYYKK